MNAEVPPVFAGTAKTEKTESSQKASSQRSKEPLKN